MKATWYMLSITAASENDFAHVLHTVKKTRLERWGKERAAETALMAGGCSWMGAVPHQSLIYSQAIWRWILTCREWWKHVGIQGRKDEDKEGQKGILILSTCRTAANIHCREVLTDEYRKSYTLMIILKSHSVAITDSVMKKAQGLKIVKSKTKAEILTKYPSATASFCLTDYGQLAWKRYWGGRIIHTDRITTTTGTAHCPSQSRAQQSQPELAAGRPGTNKAFLHTNSPRETGHWYKYLSNFQMWLEELM